MKENNCGTCSWWTGGETQRCTCLIFPEALHLRMWKAVTAEDGKNCACHSSAVSYEEARAKWIYEGTRLENVAAGRPINPEPWEQRDEYFRENMIKAVNLQCGPNRVTSPEELHNRWVSAYEKMGWKYGPVRNVEKKEHPDMVPFNELGKLEQDKDFVFFLMCEIVRGVSMFYESKFMELEDKDVS